MINRRTFYLHYDSIYDLLSEILEDMALEFLEYTKGYDHFKEIDRIVSDYFHFTHNNPLYEKLNNNTELDYIREQINDKVVQNSRGELESAKKLDVHQFNITRIYLNASTVAIYRYWYKNQRTLSMDAAINMAVSMIKDGINLN
jgi:AcrR family transcriptional regulator